MKGSCNMEMKAPVWNRSAMPAKAKQQIEVGTFWRMSKMVRREQKSAAEIDLALNSLLTNFPMSEWLRAKLNDLVILNKKRFA